MEDDAKHWKLRKIVIVSMAALLLLAFVVFMFRLAGPGKRTKWTQKNFPLNR
jgi:hypothetical protein